MPDTDQPDTDRANRWWTIGAAIVFGVLVLALIFVWGRRSAAPSDSEVDVGFLQDMTNHHEQAVQMSLMELQNGSDSVATGFAQEVILFQRFELGKMDAYLEARGLRPLDHDPDRPVMEWMGMGGTLRDMPGMASEQQMEDLAAAEGIDADLLYLQLMTEHHQGGLHMAEYAAEHAEDPKVRNLAEVIARNQRREISEYAQVIARLEAEQAAQTG
jgi:uncharacterized protein (DUF305 family)